VIRRPGAKRLFLAPKARDGKSPPVGWWGVELGRSTGVASQISDEYCLSLVRLGSFGNQVYAEELVTLVTSRAV
jgi:hypothetical protein